MNKDLTDILFESLDTIATHNSRLDKLDKTSKEVKTSIDKLQAYLELKIQESTSKALKDVLDNISISTEVKPAINEITINTESLAKEISKLVSSKPINNVNVEPAKVSVTFDTKDLVNKLDNTNAIHAVSKQIESANQSMRTLILELIKSHQSTTKVDTPKSIKIIRDKNNLIQSLEIE